MSDGAGDKLRIAVLFLRARRLSRAVPGSPKGFRGAVSGSPKAFAVLCLVARRAFRRTARVAAQRLPWVWRPARPSKPNGVS